MYFLYRVIITAGLIVLAPYFLLRGLLRGKNVRNLADRLGLRFPAGLAAPTDAGNNTIWLHAVSVGEVLAAVPLARSLKHRHPQRRLVVSTTTETGQALARERMKFADALFYFPLDLPGAVRRTFRIVRPSLIVVMETEIWPNFLRQARREGVPVAYANGRISDRSFHGFLKWSLDGFRARVFADGSLYLMQSQEDARRVMALGAPAERVIVTGNLKYDLEIAGETALACWLREELGRSEPGPVLVAGSVMAGEEQPVLQAMTTVAARWPEGLLILAPRKPERFAEAAAMIAAEGWPVVRRSRLEVGAASSQGMLRRNGHGRRPVLLLDSLGELASVYPLADAVFVGGSLEPNGGHNPLEPAVCGIAPVFGPSMENFRDIAVELSRRGAATQVASGAELGATWVALLEDPNRRAETGEAARAVVERHRGATTATLARLDALLGATAQVAR